MLQFLLKPLRSASTLASSRDIQIITQTQKNTDFRERAVVGKGSWKDPEVFLRETWKIVKLESSFHNKPFQLKDLFNYRFQLYLCLFKG